MSTLYIDRKDIELRVSSGALEFVEPTGKRGSVPLAHLERVVLHGSVRFSTSVLGALTEAGAGVLVLSGRQNRRLATCLGRPHNDVIRRIGQFDAYLDPVARAEWSQGIVSAKVRGQCRMLRRALERRADKRRPLTRAIQQIEALSRRLPDGAQPLEISVLRGIEGAAAAAYFGGLRSVFPPSLKFCGRNRRPPRDPVNACLSLGYTLLHFEAVMSCHGAGLDPLLGLFHEPAYGRNSLAADVMEPLRPHVDEWVWEMFRTRVFDAGSFSEANGGVLLRKSARQRFYTRFNPLGTALKRLLRREMRVVARRLEDRGRGVHESGAVLDVAP